MAENLSQAINYGRQFATPVYVPERQNIVADTFESASKSLQAISERKEAKEKQYKDTRDQIDSLNKTGMYQGHYDMLQEAAAILKNPETIDEYASSPEKQIQYEGMIDELNQSIDYYENYYATTFGKSGDAANGITYSSQLARDLNPSINSWGESGMQQITTDEEQTKKLAELSQGFHEKGGVTIRDGKLVYGVPGAAGLYGPKQQARGDTYKSILNQDLPAQPFKPELRAIEMNGAEYFSKVDNGTFHTKERMAAYLTNDLNKNDVVFQGVARDYIKQMKDENENYNETVEELMTNPSKRKDVIDRAIEDADKVRRRPKTTTRSMTDAQRREIKAQQNARYALTQGAAKVNRTIPTPESSDLSQSLNLPVVALDLDPITIEGETVKVTNINFESDGSITVKGMDSEEFPTEEVNIKPSDPAYGALNSLMVSSDANMSFNDFLSTGFLNSIREVESEPDSALKADAWSSFGTQE